MNETETRRRLKYAAGQIKQQVHPPSADAIIRRGDRRRRRRLASGAVAITVVVGGVVAFVGHAVSNGSPKDTLAPADGPGPISSPTLPSDTYPTASSFPDWGSASGCPSLENVESPTPDYAAEIRLATRSLNHDIAHDRTVTDQAMWPALQELADSTPINATAATTIMRPATGSPSHEVLEHNCGSEIVRRSIVEVVCPDKCSSASEPALNGELVWLRRNEQWLLWFIG